MLLWGLQDKALDPGLLRGIEDFFPQGIDVRAYEDASHWIHHEHPTRVANEIEKFITTA